MDVVGGEFVLKVYGDVLLLVFVEFGVGVFDNGVGFEVGGGE